MTRYEEVVKAANLRLEDLCQAQKDGLSGRLMMKNELDEYYDRSAKKVTMQMVDWFYAEGDRLPILKDYLPSLEALARYKIAKAPIKESITLR